MFDANSIINYGGLLLLFLVVYAQTGLFFCFFIPGGGLIFTAGVLIATGTLDHSLPAVLLLLSAATIAGNMTGYWFGIKTGPVLYKHKDSRFFRQQHLRTAEQFYHRHGAFALAAGVFLPIIRTFAPIVAGMIHMSFRRFLLFTTLGAFAYTFSIGMAGYLIGNMPFLKPYLKYLVTIIILVVTIPVVIRIIREFRKKQAV
jgi:membrane-associated protein